MSTQESTRPYELVRGTHFEGRRKVAVGEVVQLTKRQAQAFADRFEPAGSRGELSEPPETQTSSSTPTIVPEGGESRTTGPDGPSAGEGAGEGEGFEVPDLEAMNVAEVEEHVAEAESAEELDAYQEAEAAGKNRAGVLSAITKRREELEEE